MSLLLPLLLALQPVESPPVPESAAPSPEVPEPAPAPAPVPPTAAPVPGSMSSQPATPVVEPVPGSMSSKPDAAAPPADDRRSARRALNLDPTAMLLNQWPVEPYCNMNPAGKDGCVTVDAELFSAYRYSVFAGGRRFNDFALDRGEVGTQLWWRPHRRIDTGVAVRVEAIRSAGPNSVKGIDGDSLIMRLAQAYGHAAVHLGPIHLGVRFGQIPERWIEQVEKGYDTRGLEPLPSDRVMMYDRADLGASLTASGWRGLVELDLALTNGEGRAQKELNTGKNTTLIATVRPLRITHARGPVRLAIHGLYRDGSYGVAGTETGPGRNHRVAGALTVQSPWVFAGVEYSRAFGFNANPAVVADVVGAWASAYAYQPYLGIAAKYDHHRQDVRLAGSQVHVATAALFSDVFGYLWRNRRRIRLYAGYQYEGYGELAGPIAGVPVATAHRFLVQLTAQGLFRAF
jgi:hypothetical protein